MTRKLSRRDFIKGIGAGAAGVAAAGLLSACGRSETAAVAETAAAAAPETKASETKAPETQAAAAEAEAPAAAEMTAPAHPFEWHEIDPDALEERVYQGFYDLGGCARTVFAGILGTLADTYGYPYNQIPSEMYHNGHAGFNVGSLCGSLAGAAGILGLFLPTDDVDACLNTLLSWYTTTELPIYQPEYELIHTVAPSDNCADSLSTWMTAAGVAERSDPLRMSRCAGLSADVARKTVNLLNKYYGLAEAEETSEETGREPAANQYMGTAAGYGGDVTVRVTIDDGRISLVEVVEQSETPGIGSLAIEALPDRFIGLSSADEVDAVDAVSAASYTSAALKEAVKAALKEAGLG